MLSQLWGREFSGFGGPSWEQKSIKNRSKNEVMMGRHLGIDFSWILVDFEGQVGAMLGSKIDQNSIQEGIEKRMRKRKRLGGVLEAPGGGVDASRGAKRGGSLRRHADVRSCQVP